MSVLLHVCRACRHRETSHQGGDRGYSGCACCRGAGDIDSEPVLVQTWALPGWEAEPPYRPGSQWNAGTTHRLELCDCGRCHVRYSELSADAETASSTAGPGSPGPVAAALRGRAVSEIATRVPPRIRSRHSAGGH